MTVSPLDLSIRLSTCSWDLPAMQISGWMLDRLASWIAYDPTADDAPHMTKGILSESGTGSHGSGSLRRA